MESCWYLRTSCHEHLKEWLDLRRLSKEYLTIVSTGKHSTRPLPGRHSRGVRGDPRSQWPRKVNYIRPRAGGANSAALLCDVTCRARGESTLRRGGSLMAGPPSLAHEPWGENILPIEITLKQRPPRRSCSFTRSRRSMLNGDSNFAASFQQNITILVSFER